LRSKADEGDITETVDAVIELNSQRKKAEPGRYWLQVDRQTKSSHDTLQEAEARGHLIKNSFSNLQVSIYDKKVGSNQILTTQS
jgi:hypothetical protein